jgi:hypothetical protein
MRYWSGQHPLGSALQQKISPQITLLDIIVVLFHCSFINLKFAPGSEVYFDADFLTSLLRTWPWDSILLSSVFATGTRSEERPIVLQKPLHFQECNSWNCVQVLLQEIASLNNKWPVALPNFVALNFSGIDVLSMRQ